MASTSARAPSTASAARPPMTHLMLTLLKSWRDDALSRKSHSAKTYQKAYLALKACPLPFQHPRELLPLAGVGITVVQRLEDEVKAWCQEKGHKMPEMPSARALGKRKAAESSDDSSSDVSGGTDDDDDDGNLLQLLKSKKGAGAKAKAAGARAPSANSTSKPPKPAKQPKRYVPQPRSGAHGILVALYACGSADAPTDESISSRTSFLSKSCIINHATPYSDSAYVSKAMPPHVKSKNAASGGGGNFSFSTAWSGMKTLINRGLAFRSGNPPRFGLSKEGWEVARICAEREEVQPGSIDVGEEGAPVAPKAKAKKKTSADATATAAPAAKPSAFGYVYLSANANPQRVKERRLAAMRLSDFDYSPTYRIEILEEHAGHAFVKANCEGVEVDASKGVVRAWVRELGCNDVAPGLPEAEGCDEAAPTARMEQPRGAGGSRTAASKAPVSRPAPAKSKATDGTAYDDWTSSSSSDTDSDGTAARRPRTQRPQARSNARVSSSSKSASSASPWPQVASSFSGGSKPGGGLLERLPPRRVEAVVAPAVPSRTTPRRAEPITVDLTTPTPARPVAGAAAATSRGTTVCSPLSERTAPPQILRGAEKLGSGQATLSGMRPTKRGLAAVTSMAKSGDGGKDGFGAPRTNQVKPGHCSSSDREHEDRSSSPPPPAALLKPRQLSNAMRAPPLNDVIDLC